MSPLTSHIPLHYSHYQHLHQSHITKVPALFKAYLPTLPFYAGVSCKPPHKGGGDCANPTPKMGVPTHFRDFPGWVMGVLGARLKSPGFGNKTVGKYGLKCCLWLESYSCPRANREFNLLKGTCHTVHVAWTTAAWSSGRFPCHNVL